MQCLSTPFDLHSKFPVEIGLTLSKCEGARALVCAYLRSRFIQSFAHTHTSSSPYVQKCKVSQQLSATSFILNLRFDYLGYMNNLWEYKNILIKNRTLSGLKYEFFWNFSVSWRKSVFIFRSHSLSISHLTDDDLWAEYILKRRKEPIWNDSKHNLTSCLESYYCFSLVYVCVCVLARWVSIHLSSKSIWVRRILFASIACVLSLFNEFT